MVSEEYSFNFNSIACVTWQKVLWQVLPPANLRRLCFYTCVSVHRADVRGRGGHAWQRGHVWRGVYGRGCAWWRGACVAGACMAGGIHGRGHAWQGGACHSRYYGIQSISRWYTSYWNAFFSSTISSFLAKLFPQLCSCNWNGNCDLVNDKKVIIWHFCDLFSNYEWQKGHNFPILWPFQELWTTKRSQFNDYKWHCE